MTLVSLTMAKPSRWTIAWGSSPLAYMLSSTLLAVLGLITLSSTSLSNAAKLRGLDLDAGDLPQVLPLAVGIEQPEQLARQPGRHALRLAVARAIGRHGLLIVAATRLSLVRRSASTRRRPQACS